MTWVHEMPPERADLSKALRLAYRAPANDVPDDWQRLLDAIA